MVGGASDHACFQPVTVFVHFVSFVVKNGREEDQYSTIVPYVILVQGFRKGNS